MELKYEILSKLALSSHLLRCPKEERDKVVLDLIQKNLNYHYEKNEYYRRLCEESHVLPSDIRGVDDFIKIPLIPVKFFKQPDPDARYLLSFPAEEVASEIRSSGTGGVQSIARRDYDTVINVIMLYTMLYADLLRIKNGAGLFLCPSFEEMPKMGMVITFNFLNIALNTRAYAVENMLLDCNKGIESLLNWEGKYTRYIMGPPFFINNFCNHLAENNIRLKMDKDTKVLTVGGWKNFYGEQITREELDKKCIEYLGVEQSQIRDMYAMVETNTFVLECENNRKHIPGTIHISIRDIDDPNKEAAEGEPGIIAIMDPSSLAYPLYILTEDTAIMRRNVKCTCGRTTDVIEKIGRGPKSDYRTCALTLGQFMDEMDKTGKLTSNLPFK